MFERGMLEEALHQQLAKSTAAQVGTNDHVEHPRHASLIRDRSRASRDALGGSFAEHDPRVERA
jgi:hypothetical protein